MSTENKKVQSMGEPRNEFSIWTGLHLFALYTLAVSHPMYSVLAQVDSTPFFISHQADNTDLLLFVGVISFAVPAAICLSLWLLHLVSHTLARAAWKVSLVLLFFALSVPVLQHWISGPVNLVPVLAAIFAVGATATYLMTRWAKTFLSILALGIIVSPLLFITASPVRQAVSSPESATSLPSPGSNTAPDIVLLVFDELPLISLLDASFQIDSVRYPNFARLAGTSTWYRYATTVADTTRWALPAILTGDRVHDYFKRSGTSFDGKPDGVAFPDNLFSLYRGTHQIVAFEELTRFVPENDEIKKYRPPRSDRLLSLTLDTALLFAHRVVPDSFSSDLTPIYQRWTFYDADRPEHAQTADWPFAGKEPARVKEFVNAIQKSNVPVLYFLHVLLPHPPWIYNARGQQLKRSISFAGKVRRISGINDWPSEHAAQFSYRGHLLQLGFTDLLLGKILDRLEEEDVFDEALIVLTSDHGNSFYFDGKSLSPEDLSTIQASDILYVPLLIKSPHQKHGEVSDALVEVTDILPTVVDITGHQISWEIGGRSANNPMDETRRRLAMVPMRKEYDLIIDPAWTSLNYKIDLFGSGDNDRVYHIGPLHRVLGVSTESVAGVPGSIAGKITNTGRYRHMDPAAAETVEIVEGTVDGLGDDADTEQMTVLIGINGSTISAVRPVRENNEIHFVARVPSSSFLKGNNTVTAYIVDQQQLDKYLESKPALR